MVDENELPSGATAAHEVGHLMPRKVREKSLDIAKQAYYNIYGERISTVEIINYLKQNVSIYSTDLKEIYKARPNNEKYYKEILSEVLAQNITKSTDFSREFVRAIKEVVEQ